MLLWFKFPQSPILLGFGTLLAYTVQTASPTTTAYAILLPAITVLVTRYAIGARVQRPWWLGLLAIPPLWLTLRFGDGDLTSGLAVLLASFAPMPLRPNREGSGGKAHTWLIPLLVIVLTFGTGSIWVRGPRQDKVGIIDGGRWAETSTPYFATRRINIESLYSYSELAALLSSRLVSYDQLTSEISEAWLITPTEPPPDSSMEKLRNWVGQGGHLLLITDHTDLFGHGRVSQRVLRGFGMSVGLDAFFPTHPSGAAQYFDLRRGTPLMTSNTVAGFMAWPLLSARWTSEDPDYSAPNFFGPLVQSSDDRYGRRAIAVSKIFGLGRITCFGDSTIFSNFAVYQPGVEDLLSLLRTRHPAVLLLPLGVTCYVLVLLYSAWKNTEATLGAPCLIGFVLLIPTSDIRSSELENQVRFSGRSELTRDWTDPNKSLSTSYAFLPAVGIRPRWTDSSDVTSLDDGGVWISEEAPPTDKWVWLNPDANSESAADEPNTWHEITGRINHSPPSPWPVMASKVARARRVWTNSAMGDWWADQGVSKQKLLRLQALAAVIRSEPEVRLPERVLTPGPGALQDYDLLVEGQPVQRVDVPTFTSQLGEVYLGEGVSATIIERHGSRIMVGTKAQVEGWLVPKAWSLMPRGSTFPAKRQD